MENNTKEAIKFFSLAIAAVAVLIALIITLGNDNITRAEESKKAPAVHLDNTTVHKYVDPETGVNYLIYDGVKQGGITVRYNTDGSIMVTPQN